MKEFKTYREFKKCCRKYYKRNSVKRYFKFDSKRKVSYWTLPFCYYILNDPAEILSNNAYNKYNFIYDIEREYFDEHKDEWCCLIGKKVELFTEGRASIQGVFGGFAVLNNGVNFYVTDAHLDINSNEQFIFRIPMLFEIKEI